MWVDIYGRQAKWNGKAWELVESEGQSEFDKPKGPAKVKLKNLIPLHVSVSGVKARDRLERMDPDDPLVKAYSELPDNQLGIVRMYTQNYYTKFNNHLRGRDYDKSDDREEEFVKQATSEMIDAMNSIPDSPVGSYYRGMSGDPNTSRTVQMCAELEPGDILSDKGFGSFTSDKEIPGDFMTYGGKNQNILLINRSGRLKNVDPVTANPGESEHLSMPGAEFRVKKNDIVEDRRYGKMRIIEIEDV